MKWLSFLVPVLWLFLPACGPSRPDVSAQHSSVEIEKRNDGLFYRKSDPTPFTGEVIVLSHGNKREAVEVYQAGKPHGTWLRFWSDGSIKREEQWVHGSQVHQRQWYEDGKQKEDLNMKDGKGNGRILLWWPDGRLRRTGFVGDDLRPHGHSLEYASDGTVVVDAIFDQGRYVSGLLRKDVLASRSGNEAD